MFIRGLNQALEGQGQREQQLEQPEQDENPLSDAQKTSKSIQELTGMLAALSKNGNKHE